MEAIETSNEFQVIVRDLNAPQEKANAIAETLSTYFAKHKEYKKLISELVINDINDTGKMAMAREGRLDLRRKRLEAEKVVKENRDRLKIKMSDDQLEDKLWLKSGQLIVALFDDLETALLEKEKYAENEIKRQKAEKAAQRRKLLEPYQDFVNVMAYDLENMPDDQFEMTLQGIQHSYNLKQEQMRLEVEKTARFDKRKTEMQIKGIMFDGEQYYVPGIEGAYYLISVLGLKEIDDDYYAKLLNEGIKALEDHKRRQEETEARLKKLQEEKELRTIRLSKLLNSVYDGKSVYFNGAIIMSDEELIGMNDNQFQKQVKVHEIRVSEYNKEQELLKQEEQKRLEAERRNSDRKKILFGLGFSYNGTEFIIPDVAKITLEELEGQADHVFDVRVKAVQSKLKQIEESKAAQEKLEAGSDKEKLIALYNSLMNIKLPVPKTKKVKQVLDSFEVDFRKSLETLNNSINKI